jgi:hypothetical protein
MRISFTPDKKILRRIAAAEDYFEQAQFGRPGYGQSA